MALFKSNQELENDDYDDYGTEEPYYDDGFDELNEEEEPEIDPEVKKEIKKDRLRVAVGAGNLIAIIGGTVAILILLTLIFNMVIFVINDMGRNFTLFQANN